MSLRSLSCVASGALALSVLGCGSSDDETGTSNAGPPGGGGSAGTTGTGGEAGGGGDVAATGHPNGKEPCEGLSSGWDGDDLCILPPAPGTGLHMHAGPSDYDDPDEVAPFVIQPGEEPTHTYRFHSTNTEEVRYYEQYFRMRPGSHHLFVNVMTDEQPDGWYPTEAFALGGMVIGGTQNSNYDFPAGGVIPPEDENLYRGVGPNQAMAFEMHYVNATGGPVLREGWVNFMATDPAEPQPLAGVFMVGLSIDVPPGVTMSENFTSDASTATRRIHSLFGHYHANGNRFSVWAHTQGQRMLIYEDYNWSEPAELLYNTATTNPAPDLATATAGGHTGMLTLEPGDFLEWECEYTNNNAINLRFGNGVYDQEMCNLFGAAVVDQATIEAGGGIWLMFK